MMTEDLFDRILVKPVNEGANKLFIVSGYATSAMAFNHLEAVQKINPNVSVNLIVGMCGQDGLSESNHRGFQNLMTSVFPGSFECSYVMNLPPVHSKIYVWYENNNAKQGFLGSANYTQTAFNNKQRRETMVQCSAADGLSYFKALTGDTIYCTHADTEALIEIYNDRYYQRLRRQKQAVGAEEDDDDTVTPKTITAGLLSVKVRLVDRYGEVPDRSGLNWGQRPDRNPNQAYLSLSSDIYGTDFFPDRAVHFTVYTDDGRVLICTRAQDNGKAIETPHNNSLIGEYFRNRLGLPLGAKVDKSDLQRYGRTDVDFYRIDDENYFMDFSIQKN